ncbi:MAG TPA: hypothetical protein VI913_02490 [Candidatus Peribacteraceae bacterium]|nr:hypothetical protein [Candidatus Peribacteraceae bacterium]
MNNNGYDLFAPSSPSPASMEIRKYPKITVPIWAGDKGFSWQQHPIIDYIVDKTLAGEYQPETAEEAIALVQERFGCACHAIFPEFRRDPRIIYVAAVQSRWQEIRRDDVIRQALKQQTHGFKKCFNREITRQIAKIDAARPTYDE